MYFIYLFFKSSHFSFISGHIYIQLQNSGGGVRYWSAVVNLSCTGGLSGAGLQRHISHCWLLPALGRSLQGFGGWLLHTQAALWWSLGLWRDRPGWGWLWRVPCRVLPLWDTDTAESGAHCWPACLLFQQREMQLPAELRWWEWRERLQSVSAWYIPLR